MFANLGFLSVEQEMLGDEVLDLYSTHFAGGIRRKQAHMDKLGGGVSLLCLLPMSAVCALKQAQTMDRDCYRSLHLSNLEKGELM